MKSTCPRLICRAWLGVLGIWSRPRTQSFAGGAGEGASWAQCNVVIDVCDFPNFSVRRSQNHVVTVNFSLEVVL